MEKINAVITGVGGYVPNYILDNDEMSRIVDTSDEWIMQRIGVKTRHILRPEQGSGTSYLMKRAVKQLLRKTQVDPASVELVICATTTPDYHCPSTASLVIDACSLPQAFGFDMEAACSGFLYALEVGANFVRSGRYKRIIVCELNTGQFASYLRAQLSGIEMEQYNEIQGQPFAVERIVKYASK